MQALTILATSTFKDYYSVLAHPKFLACIATFCSLKETEKVVAFCNSSFTVHILSEIAKACKVKAARFIGSTTSLQRERAVSAFQDDLETRLFITTQRVGGVGLTLTSGRVVLLWGASPAVGLTEQAISRVHRYGQVRPVVVLRMQIPNSIESRIHAYQREQNTLGYNHDLIDAAGQRVQAQHAITGDSGAAAVLNENTQAVSRSRRVRELRYYFTQQEQA